jgi:hypothetical protein
VSEDRSIRQGDLLLEPSSRAGLRPTLWTVQGSGKAPKTLLANDEGTIMKATLRKSEVPEGWTRVKNRALAKHLTDYEKLRGAVRMLYALVGLMLKRRELNTLQKEALDTIGEWVEPAK